MFESEVAEKENNYVPPKRLLKLLKQAVAYQVEFARYHPNVTPKISTLLHDFSPLIIPNSVKSIYLGHTKNVKCLSFLGQNGTRIITGSSDNTLRVWKTETAECLSVLSGHDSRIWDVSSTDNGSFVASASGDSTLKVQQIN